MLVSVTAPLTLDGLLGQVISAVRRALLVRGEDGDAVRALDAAARADLPWQDRWAVLREHVLGAVQVLAVLDNFEDNLKPSGESGYQVRDEVLAGLLAAWVTDPGTARLLVTSRYPFTLPGGAERELSFRRLGPLSRAETMKLAWSLPALDRLDEGQLERVRRLAPPVAGVPRRAAVRRHRPLPRRHRPAGRRGQPPPGRGGPGPVAGRPDRPGRGSGRDRRARRRRCPAR